MTGLSPLLPSPFLSSVVENSSWLWALPYLGGSLLLMCQAKQMWRGDNIYFHNSEQIWRAASLSSGACSCRKPNSPAALAEVFIAPLSLPSCGMGCVGLGTWTPDGGRGRGGGGLLQGCLRNQNMGHTHQSWVVGCQLEADLGANNVASKHRPPTIQQDRGLNHPSLDC